MLRTMTIHRLSNVDGAARTADCAACGHVSIRVRGTNRSGASSWRCLGRLVTRHQLADIDEPSRTAFCRGCRETVEINSNSARSKGWVCAVKQRADAALLRASRPEELRATNKAWRDANPGRIRDYQLQRLYGISIEQYRAEVAKRGGRCDVCHEAPSGNGPNGMTLCVEHDHGTGAIRGYADRDCNTMIGAAGEDPLRLAQGIIYLKPTDEQLAEIIKRLEWFRDVRGIVATSKG
jgi:hypothetical protein